MLGFLGHKLHNWWVSQPVTVHIYCVQADVCHAYQVLKKGGLKDENIVVFMFDDIAHHRENPRPGTIINHPQGGDVYKGVPKVGFVSGLLSCPFFIILDHILAM